MSNSLYDSIKLKDVRNLLKKYGFTVDIPYDAGRIEVSWSSFSAIANSNLKDKFFNRTVFSCYVVNDYVANVIFERPSIVSRRKFKDYIHSVVMENFNEPAGTDIDTISAIPLSIEELESLIKEAIFIIKWSIDFQNSDMLDRARSKLRELPKADEAAFFERHFEKFENIFVTLLKDARFLD